jgi:hypothetical protein
MKKLIYIGIALATFGVAFFPGAKARAASGYWNNSGFAISHEYYPGHHSSFSYYNYAPRYYGSFNRVYFGKPDPYRLGSATEAQDIPAPVDWSKKCGSSCLDLSGDR